MERFDERDTIFSRMELAPGSKRYEDYYARHPELKEIDDRFRDLPGGTYSHEQIDMARINSGFRFLKDIRPLATGSVRSEISPYSDLPLKKIEQSLRAIAFDYGAALYGQAALGPDCFYSVRGRGPAYGIPVTNPLQNALVFAVEMDRDKVSRAPRPEETIEVVRAYVHAALIGMILSYYLRELGFEARCHMDGESELVLPASAVTAGLGTIGRAGLLLTADFGLGVRLGAVTTNFPITLPSESVRIISSQPADICLTCDLCARRCPGKAIPFGALPKAEGLNKPAWKINHEACFSTWKKFATDCGICIAACPYAHRKSSV